MKRADSTSSGIPPGRDRGRLPQGLRIFLCILGIFFLSDFSRAEEYSFNLEEIDKKPYHLGGYAEIHPILLWPDDDAAFYRLKYYDIDAGSPIKRYDLTLQLEGSYEKDASRIFARVNSSLQHDDDGWSDETVLYEGYFSHKPSAFLILEAGKKNLKWGKGYAWNPVAFVDRPKDPDDPDLNLEGFFMGSADYTRSFQGSLKTVSLTLALVPVYGDLNDDFGEQDHLNAAVKLYLLWRDTDIDFMALAGESKPQRYGMDFSRNLFSNLEIHGELAWIRDFEKSVMNASGTLIQEDEDVWSALLGLRYLSAIETTYFLEYYHNGTGFTEQEMNDFFAFVEKGYERFISSGDAAPLRKAGNLAEGRYGRPNPMKNYLYARISQKEPLDILYFTPAITGILNLEDRSYSISPELLYTGVTNFEMRLKGTVLAGDRFSEYGEKQNDYRLEFRIRYFF